MTVAKLFDMNFNTTEYTDPDKNHCKIAFLAETAREKGMTRNDFIKQAKYFLANYKYPTWVIANFFEGYENNRTEIAVNVPLWFYNMEFGARFQFKKQDCVKVSESMFEIIGKKTVYRAEILNETITDNNLYIEK